MYFNLDAVAGCEVPGLVLGLFFDSRFPDLQEPQDDVLKQVLDTMEIDLPDATGRDAFFRCWAAQTATMSSTSLLSFLQQKDASLPADAVIAEVNQLETLLDTPLPDGLKFSIANTICSLSRERAQELRARTRDPYVAETLETSLKLL